MSICLMEVKASGKTRHIRHRVGFCDLRVWLDALPSGAVIHGSAQAQGWNGVKV